MRVWIDQELCTGDGLCEDLCPEVFSHGDDGLAYVHEHGTVPAGGGPQASVVVSPALEAGVLDAQAQCVAECIYLEG